MNLKFTTLSLTCALALAACGDNSPPPAQDTNTPAAAPATSATQPPATTPAPPVDAAAPDTAATDMGDAGAGAGAGAATNQAATDAAAPASGKPAADVANCSTTIEGSDAMQFNVGSITVPSSCTEFTITLEHTGQLPVVAMGHNVVIAKASDRTAIASEGASAGAEGGYLKDGDERVIAHTDMIGGGQTASVTFPTSAIQGDGPYEFFCSFPGHWAVMRGSIQVG